MATTSKQLFRPRMRPAFTVLIPCDPERLVKIFGRRLDMEEADVEGDFTARHGVLRIPLDQTRFWTPCLELMIDEVVEDESDSGNQISTIHTRLWGTFTPRPEVWTAFVFAIGTLVILSVLSSVYGLAQLALTRTPIALLVPPVCVLFAGILYLAALVGQGLSLAEMYRLRAFVDDALRDAEAPEEELKPPAIRIA